MLGVQFGDSVPVDARQVLLFTVSQSDGHGRFELFAAHFAGEFAIDADALIERGRAI